MIFKYNKFDQFNYTKIILKHFKVDEKLIMDVV